MKIEVGIKYGNGKKKKKEKQLGVPFVTQWLINPARIHEDAGLIPGLSQWVGNPELP